jgi:hypothetical protein
LLTERRLNVGCEKERKDIRKVSVEYFNFLKRLQELRNIYFFSAIIHQI